MLIPDFDDPFSSLSSPDASLSLLSVAFLLEEDLVAASLMGFLVCKATGFFVTVAAEEGFLVVRVLGFVVDNGITVLGNTPALSVKTLVMLTGFKGAFKAATPA